MEVTIDLNVSQEAFFDFLVTSIIQDIEQNTSTKILKADIKPGYSYAKKLKTKVGKMGSANVNIVAFEPNAHYAASFESNQGTNFISYQVKKLEADKINVTYIEEFIAADKLKEWNFKLVHFIYKKKSIQRAETNLKNIEAYILSKGGKNK